MSIKVLYIEDNFENRMLVTRVLMAEGFEFQGAANALQGIEMAMADPPDIILMDINMPGKSGLDATRDLRANPLFSDIPIIALTANITQDVLSQTLEAGCNGYITKPIDVDRLPGQIMSYLR
jgi:CheY-like chemotaxis protein